MLSLRPSYLKHIFKSTNRFSLKYRKFSTVNNILFQKPITYDNKYNSVENRFSINEKQKNKSNQKLFKILIFGVSFGLGWFVTQHMTFMDIMASIKYDDLPENSQQVLDYENSLTNRLNNLSISSQLENAGYAKIYNKANTLIDKTLKTPGGVAIDPQFYYNPAILQTVGIYHLGMKLTGYPFIIHGGVLATIMEDFMRNSIKLIKDCDVEETNKLNISYKFPTFANQFVVIRSVSLQQLTPHKWKLEAEIMNENGKRTLVKGTGVFTLP
ncbi:related to Fmp10p [Saccharomycodes ludwigii]|uniref:Related to Fmp10p n=1 Tax=Saccharomycodes ludwigii TaxID=36035 RepID=A0A376BC01_9ASCO|nr:hypothetical protein SCDLUD_004400 [Saccharomycodes ludwigii]KAH3900080.1 hypothetical protein SCDLUD_004400 [Saccharomycodes ludwigii]SSD62146.1 related to Fmp10p [Saccharomycodes ludwigii]